ncbi:pirin family protein, partial [Candidatus Woesearchaeota archaeon]|nr:pirin family protein [Candidatus Woesearchaeota archaeon]
LGRTSNINQDAKISLGIFEKEQNIIYNLSNKQGLFILIIDDSATVQRELLAKRDAIAISETKLINIKVNVKSFILAIEVGL